MKFDISKYEYRLAPWQPRLLSALRIIAGLLLFQYGIAKIFKFPFLPYFAYITPLVMFAGILELVLGAMLILGIYTRFVAFVLAGEMAFAYFIGHMFQGGTLVLHPLLNGGSLAIALCFICLYIASAGPGPWSLDATHRGKI
ncbi:MAG TPA: DoxX family protein [Afipia sp.]